MVFLSTSTITATANISSNTMNNDVLSSPTASLVSTFLIDNYGSGIAVCVFVAIATVIVSQQGLYRRKKQVPFAPQVGPFEIMGVLGGRDAPMFLLKVFRRVQEATGRSCYRLPLPIPWGFYVVGDAELQRKIMKDKDVDKATNSYITLLWNIGARESIYTSSINPHWKLVRKSTSFAFANAEINTMKEITLRRTQEWCEEASKNFVGTNSFDPSAEMIRLTFKIVCEAAFEFEVNDDDIIEFQKELELTLREFTFRQGCNPIRFVFGIVLPEVRRANLAGRRVHDLVRRILDSYRKKTDKSTRNTLIKLIEGLDISDKQKVTEILFYLVAGHDTTGITIANSMILLAKHQNVLQKLKEEVKDLPYNEWCKVSQYYNNVQRESARLMPTTGMGSLRELPKDFDAGMNEILPKGAIVILPQILATRNTNTFTSNADVYDPERWNNETDAMKNSLMPFALGIRNCVGQALANAELDIILPYILSQFDLELLQDGFEDFFLTLRYADVKLRLRPTALNLQSS